MEIIIKQQQLLKALNIVDNALTSKTVLPILRGIKIIAKDNKLTFIASKNELAIQYTLDDINIISEGAIVVQGSQFINIVKKLSDEQCELNINTNDNLVIIQTPNSKVSLITLDTSSYPDINYDSNDETITIPKSLIKRAYNKAKYTTAQNSSNIIFSAINLNFTNENLIASSTDSKRLSYVKLDPIDNLQIQMNISKHLYQNIMKVLELIDDEQLEVKKNNKQIQIETTNLRLKGRLIDGEYPPVANLIPSDFNYSFEIDSNLLLSALDKVQSLSEKNTSVVTLEHIEGKILIKFFLRELGGIEELIEIENEQGTPFKIAFESSYVVDALHSISKEKVKFSFAAETSAFQVNGVNDEKNIQIISPIRMS